MSLRKQGTSLFAGRRGRLGFITLVAVMLNAAVGFAQPAQRPPAFCPVDPGPAPGTELIDVSSQCTPDDVIGRVPSNAAETAASLDGRTVHLVYSDVSDPADAMLVTLVDGQCQPTAQVNINPAATSNSHDAPSVFVDGEGYVYVAYHGDTYGLLGPLIRKSRQPGVPTSFGREVTSRTYSGAEVHGFTGRDGAVYIVSHNTSTRLEGLEPNGRGGAISYRFAEGPLQVIAGDSNAISITGCTGAATEWNRFTKGYITEAVRSDGSTFLLALWGWGGGDGPACKDIRHYGEDSHEVFFAYSEDGGRTWWNREGTTSRVAEHCVQGNGCPSIAHGIAFNDPAFILTRTRQRQFRAAYYDAATDTIYAAFSKSLWCDKGVCLSKSVKDPGALMFLRFQLDSGFVVERKISNGSYQHIAAITRGDGDLHVYAADKGDLYDHVSEDDGVTWQRSRIGTFGRAHGVGSLPCSPSTALVAGASNGSPLMYYRQTFADGGGSGGGPRQPPPPAPLTEAQAECVSEVDKTAGRLWIRQDGHHNRCLIQTINGTLKEPTFDDCIALESTRVASAEQSVRATHASYCASDAAPSFGLLDDMDALNQGVIQSGEALTEDVFGQPASIADGPIRSSCQQGVMDARIGLANAFWEEARAATDLALGVEAVESDAELAASLDAALTANPRIQSELATLENQIVGSCPTNVSGLFPGLCATNARRDLVPCVGQRVLCRACQGFDATGNLGLDCDAISGGLCP